MDAGLELGVEAQIEASYRSESRHVLATLIRLLGDFDLAEEALQDAFTAAAAQWPQDGVPGNPRAWLVSTGRFKAIDRLRRRARFDSLLGELASRIDDRVMEPTPDDQLVDDRLRLIFICCHPALTPDAQVAMTLREVCGLTTEQIAHAFLTKPTAVAQRIVRAKSKIRSEGIPYEVPEGDELSTRMDTVLHVLYLLFNEGYSASSGDTVTRHRLSEEAIRVCRLLVALLPDPEAVGLLALMLLQDSRRQARTSPDGDMMLLPDQDRSLWDRELVAEGMDLVETAMSAPALGTYALQAAIAAEHARSTTAADTDWDRIVSLYDLLLQADPSPVVELNRAVAVSMSRGPEAGLAMVDDLLGSGELQTYHLAHAARADLLRQMGRNDEARTAYQQALDLAQQEPERRFLAGRIREL
ncbi:MAG TPA: RNA polymerase sigma factor [Acidimicrobiia bacterium]|nr:RNA polymerase sigma factor [Acidimicrobiia bacterium]